MILSAPKASSRPSVARNTPPSLPTSSPRTRTLSSSRIASARAWRTASTMVVSAISVSIAPGRCPRFIDKGLPLLFQRVREGFIEPIEHAFDWLRRSRFVQSRSLLDFFAAGPNQVLFLDFAPAILPHHEVSESRDGLLLPVCAHVLIVSVAPRIICRGMVAQSVGDSLHERGTASCSGSCQCVFEACFGGDNVVPVDLLPSDAGR